MQLSIGHRLAGARRARGLSILDVSHKTRISPVNIRHIESGEYSKCPSLVYAKGFLKQLDSFLSADLSKDIDNFDTGPSVTTPEVLITVPDSPARTHKALAAQTADTRPAFVGLMIGILLVVTLPVAAIKWHDSQDPDSLPIAKSEPPATSPQPQAKEVAPHLPKVAITEPHLPHDAPPELASIARFEDNVELDELSPPALPATQPVPTLYSTPAVATATVASHSMRNRAQVGKKTSPSSAVREAPQQPKSPQKKSFFSRLFGSKRR